MDIIEDAMNKLCVPSGTCPGIAVCYGTHESCISKFKGNDGASSVISESTMYDLASVTKMFLAFIYLKLVEEGIVDLDKEIKYYTDRFPYIKRIKLSHLLSFNAMLSTEIRIDACRNRLEALNVLNGIKGDFSNEQQYSDMPSIVLGELLNEVTGITFGAWINKVFVAPLKLKNTVWENGKKKQVCSYENEKWYIDNQLIPIQNTVGEVNDPKSRILGENSKYLCGNAGLFSTVREMGIISQAILNRQIIKEESIKKIAEGSGWDKKGQKQTFGFQCYRKYLNPIQTEVPLNASDYAISASGFTGVYWLIDIEMDKYMFIAGNRLNNSISKISPKTSVTGGKIIIDNIEYRCSVDYVYHRDELRDLIYNSI